ncbi:DNA primase [Streptomyces sp. Qhu-G9]|uniref:DNA primase n=1 Tax=Streptomyces sp. Qhu-G9 TaxID=3452799 RepID=UPI0022AC54AD|nr:DNA primase [Streptomyces aurantiacus]WAU84070.1 DNA primase [Streptomyces aurantiacus]
MNRLGLGLAVGAGYVLGRTKKMKLAFAVGTMVAGKRMQLSPRALADLVSQQLQNNPQFKEIGDQLRQDLRGVGKAASGALVERQITGLADRLHGRTSQVQDQLAGVVPDAVPDVPGARKKKRRQDEEPEDEYDEDEYDEDERYDDSDDAPRTTDDVDDDEAADRGSADDGSDDGAEDSPPPRKRAPAKKTAKKAAEKRSPAKEAPAKKTAAKAAKKAPAKKTAARRTTRARTTRGGGDDD